MRMRPAKKRANSLNIVVVGCGKVGRSISEQLVREGHDVTVVDTDPGVIRGVGEVLDVMGIVGNGASLRVLREAGIQQADILIAMTGSDELNLLCCTVARRASSELVTIACVRSPDYGEEVPYLRQQLGLSMIVNPEQETAREISRMLSRPQALNISSFAKGQAELVRFKIPRGNKLDGRSLIEVNSLFDFNYLICAVEREGSVTIPAGSFRLRAGDDITIIASTRDVHRIFSSIDMYSEAVRSCMIVGGGRSSYYLARLLLYQHMDVTIIEANPARCNELCTLLPEARIVNGNGSDEALLREEGIDSQEAFVPLTGIDEENILMTLYAKHRVPGLKTITKINRITFNDVIDSLDLGSVIYPKYITCEAIIAYVRARQNTIGSNVETLYHMFDNRVEAIEFHVKEDAPVIGVPLMELSRKLKDSLLIACINRGGRIIFPRGQDAILKGDAVVVVTTHTGFGDLSDILA